MRVYNKYFTTKSTFCSRVTVDILIGGHKARYSPPWQGGVAAHQKNVPVPLKAQTGWLVKSRSLLIDARAAHRLKPFHKERCAALYKEASQHKQPPPRRLLKGGSPAFLEFGASPPPCQGGD